MIEISKIILEKYYFIKNFISGIRLFGSDLYIFKNKKINLYICNIKIDNNNIFLFFKNRKIQLLLNKKEIFFILNFIKNKLYFCIPIKIFKINSFFKIKISLVKKRG